MTLPAAFSPSRDVVAVKTGVTRRVFKPGRCRATVQTFFSTGAGVGQGIWVQPERDGGWSWSVA